VLPRIRQILRRERICVHVSFSRVPASCAFGYVCAWAVRLRAWWMDMGVCVGVGVVVCLVWWGGWMNVSHESVGAKTGAAIAVFGVDVCLFCVLLFL
jgi:hypothetical protein